MMMTKLELRTYFAAYELRIITLEQDFLELRYNHNHDDKGRFCSGGGGSSSEKGITGKRKNNTSDNKVNLEYINSENFKNKFKQITNNTKVNEQIYSQAKAMLIHRNGTNKEDMCLINSETGKIEGRQTSSKSEFGVDYNESLNNAIKNNPENTLISLHNHPTNNPPTGSDIISNGAKKYKMGVVVTHSGEVYTYKAGKSPFREDTFSKRVDKYKKFPYNLSEKNAIKHTLNDFKYEYDIEWGEIK